jgi:hypothetical protein
MNIQSYDTAVLSRFVVVGTAPKFEFNCHGSSGILLHRYVEHVETSVEVLRIRLCTKQQKLLIVTMDPQLSAVEGLLLL